MILGIEGLGMRREEGGGLIDPARILKCSAPTNIGWEDTGLNALGWAPALCAKEHFRITYDSDSLKEIKAVE